MAIAKVVTFTDRKWGVATNPYTGSIDCTGCDALYVMLGTNQAQSVTGMTYNGVSMTLVSANTSGSNKIWVYRLANPTTGTNSLSISFDASCSYFHVAAIGFSGTNTASLEGATPRTSYDNSNVTATNDSITTQYANSWVVDFILVGSDGITSFAGSNSQTSQIDYKSGFSSEVGSLLVSSAGATTSNYTWASITASFARTTIEIRAAATAASFIPRIIMS